MLENLDKIMHLRFNFDACLMHSPYGFVHLTHQNISARALFCLNSLAKVNTQLLIYNWYNTVSVRPGGVLTYLAERGFAALMGRFLQEILKHGSLFLPKNP